MTARGWRFRTSLDLFMRGGQTGTVMRLKAASEGLSVPGYRAAPQSAGRAMPSAWGGVVTRYPKLGAAQQLWLLY